MQEKCYFYEYIIIFIAILTYNPFRFLFSCSNSRLLDAGDQQVPLPRQRHLLYVPHGPVQPRDANVIATSQVGDRGGVGVVRHLAQQSLLD
jgi:hypothetical protein